MKFSWASATLVVVLTATGCGSADPQASPVGPTPSASPSVSPSETITATPATGATIRGTGYAFKVPAGWRDVTATVSGQPDVDRAAGAKVPVKGFASNVNVVLSTGGSPTPTQIDQLAEQIRTAMRAKSAHYTVLAPVTVNGIRSAHLAGMSSPGRDSHWLEQYVVVTPKKSYVFSFSFSPAIKPAVRRHTIDSILASWTID